MAKSIIELTRGIPTTSKGWLEIFSRINRFLQVSGDELIIGGDIQLPSQSVGSSELEDGAVTDVKLRESQARSVIGRALGSAGAPTDIQASGDGHFLRQAGGVLSFGQINGSDIPAEIARTTDVDDAISDHLAAADPHSQYSTAAEVSSAISTALTNITSGTYTPTLANTTNVSGSTAYLCQYLRVGSVVTVSGVVDLTPTSTSTQTQLGVSLPIASNFGASIDCCGVVSCIAVQQAGGVAGDAANNRASIIFSANDTSNRAFYFTFTYRVI